MNNSFSELNFFGSNKKNLNNYYNNNLTSPYINFTSAFKPMSSPINFKPNYFDSSNIKFQNYNGYNNENNNFNFHNTIEKNQKSKVKNKLVFESTIKTKSTKPSTKFKAKFKKLNKSSNDDFINDLDQSLNHNNHCDNNLNNNPNNNDRDVNKKLDFDCNTITATTNHESQELPLKLKVTPVKVHNCFLTLEQLTYNTLFDNFNKSKTDKEIANILKKKNFSLFGKRKRRLKHKKLFI